MPRSRSRREGLFDRIASFEALAAAALRAVAGKRRTPVPAAFPANLETEALRLERELRSGRWRPGRYVEIEVTDPKRRPVSAAPFRDRVVHHAVHAVVAPLFERGFIHHSYANRAGKGTHRAVARYERLRDRHRYVLRGDVFRYFPAIDHAILKADLRRRIGCRRTSAVLDRIIDGSNPQEPVHHYYPGDDLFTPFGHRRGLPIGNLTSQLFANVYLDRFDHFATEVLRAPYLRYVDDFALFADEPARLEAWRARAGAFPARRRLSLHPAKTRVVPAAEPAAFLGYVLLPGGRRRLPERTSGASGTGCGVCATAGGPVRWRGPTWSSASPRGWRTRRTPTRGGCAARSSGAGGSRRAAAGPGGLTGPLSSCVARRLVEQQSAEPPLCQPQQEHRRQSQQQHRFPCGGHAPTSEPGRVAYGADSARGEGLGIPTWPRRRGLRRCRDADGRPRCTWMARRDEAENES